MVRLRRNGWKIMRDDIIAMQRSITLMLAKENIVEMPPEIELLRNNLDATRRTLEQLWVKS